MPIRSPARRRGGGRILPNNRQRNEMALWLRLFRRRSDLSVETIALHRDTAGLLDKAYHLAPCENLSLIAMLSIFIGYLVLMHGADHVIGSIPEGHLSNLSRIHDPEGFDVREVIQHKAGDGNGTQIVFAGGVREIGKFGAFGMERQGGHGNKMAR